VVNVRAYGAAFLNVLDMKIRVRDTARLVFFILETKHEPISMVFSNRARIYVLMIVQSLGWLRFYSVLQNLLCY
jgi:hypothetical protein